MCLPTSKFSFRIAAGLAGLCLLSGCDFLRSLAGRPVSADLEQMRSALAQNAARPEPDTLEVPELSAEQCSCPEIHEPESRTGIMILASGRKVPVGSPVISSHSHRYFVLVGTFAQKENLDRMVRTAALKGYEAEMVRYGNGLVSVGLCPSDDLPLARKKMAEVSSQPFSPKDICLLEIQ